MSATAPAKVNLTLHVTGRRDDGYHLLDSLVVFADVGDVVTVQPGPALSLSVGGPFALGVPTDESNLVLKAAHLLAERNGVDRGAALRLEKHLPHAAGLGGGSSDAAATLQLLAEFWQVSPLTANDPAVAALGADVPACLSGPAPLHMTGIGDGISAAPTLPRGSALVLVNPRIDMPTASVFQELTKADNPAMDTIPADVGLDDFASWLGNQRNDLLPAARTLSPVLDQVLDRLQRLPAVKAVGLSGSGATCWALVADMAAARQAARAVQVAEMSWWVAPAAIMGA